MGFRLIRPDTAFSAPAKQRRPRVRESEHLAFIRTLPCLVCGARNCHAAHIRTAAPRYGKRATGIAEKPDDAWVTPLCPAHHTTGPEAQHASDEMGFWRKHGIDPFATSLALWRVSGDEEAAELIIRETRESALLTDQVERR